MPENGWLSLVLLALIQGITEFLPISSSAHLILVPALTGWSDQGLGIDVAMHIGTLFAVMLYFRADLLCLSKGAIDALQGRITDNAVLTLKIGLATVPVVVVGFILRDIIAGEFRSPALIAVTTAVFGVVLWMADRRASTARCGIGEITWRDAMLIGLAQAIALVPGVSRSGITITAALFLGVQRSEAARFSLLLSIPTTAAAGALGGYELVQTGSAAMLEQAVLAGGLAFVSALLAIAGLMKWLSRSDFTPFVIYRLLLAVVLGAAITFGIIPG